MAAPTLCFARAGVTWYIYHVIDLELGVVGQALYAQVASPTL